MAAPVGGATALTRRSALDLAAAIRSGETSAVEVVEAHIACHERVNPETNALVAQRFALARREAADADARRDAEAAGARRDPAASNARHWAQATDRRPVPDEPLRGVPFTVKESIAVAGMPQSAGLVARRDVRARVNAPPVQRLIDAGAIPLGVTNTSELTLWIESTNRLYGRTHNPYDRHRAAGGSSGGEGAAVGSGASPFGLASDIAGSIRIPALFCGAFGHKPSSGLVPTTGNYPPSDGANSRMLGIGPIARRAEDLMPLLRIIAGPDGRDSSVSPMELGDPAAVSLEGLTVLLLEGTARRAISRDMHSARERAAGALAALGARLQRRALPSWRWALMPFLATLQAGAPGTTAELLIEAGADAPTLRRLLAPGGPHTGPTRLTLAGDLLPPPSEAATERLLRRGRELADELSDAVGDGVLLHPVHPTAAPRHGRTTARLGLLTAAAMFNLAGLPVTEVPLGRTARGLPLGVQVASRVGADHVTIAVAMVLERLFGGWSAPPSSAGTS